MTDQEKAEIEFERILNLVTKLTIVIINHHANDIPNEIHDRYKAGYLCEKLAEKLQASV